MDTDLWHPEKGGYSTQDSGSSSPSYPADNSKQQQLIEKSDGHENGAMMITGVHIVTLMASATILAPSAWSPFDARFRLVIAPLPGDINISGYWGSRTRGEVAR